MSAQAKAMAGMEGDLSCTGAGISVGSLFLPWGHREIPAALFELSSKLPMRRITINDQPYLERYALQIIPGVRYRYLHRFISGDGDRYLHSHPWDQAEGRILFGGYQERRRAKGQKTIALLAHSPGESNIIMGDDLHQITSVADNTWTLFSHSEWDRDWGFINEANQYVNSDNVSKGANRGWWDRNPTGENHPDRHPRFGLECKFESCDV